MRSLRLKLERVAGLSADLIYYFRRFPRADFWRLVKTNFLPFFGVSRLERIFISPSHQCNANCVHCYENFGGTKVGDYLTAEEVKEIIDQFERLGGCWVFFCSGEFLLRPDALELVTYAAGKKMAVSVATNGLIIDEKKINELKSAGLSELIVSIDSADAETHDRKRGTTGCFDRAVNAVRLAQAAGLATSIWTYVSRSNSDGLAGLAELAKSLKTYVFVYFPLLSGRFFAKFEENMSRAEREEFRRQYNGAGRGVVLEFQRENDFCRGGGLRHVCVMPSGEVTFCPAVPYGYGNVKDESLQHILKRVWRDRKKFFHCRGQCMVNFKEYREENSGRFLYKQE